MDPHNAGVTGRHRECRRRGNALCSSAALGAALLGFGAWSAQAATLFVPGGLPETVASGEAVTVPLRLEVDEPFSGDCELLVLSESSWGVPVGFALDVVEGQDSAETSEVVTFDADPGSTASITLDPLGGCGEIVPLEGITTVQPDPVAIQDEDDDDPPDDDPPDDDDAPDEEVPPEEPETPIERACAAILALDEDARTPEQEDILATCDRVESSDNPDDLLDRLDPRQVAAQGRAGIMVMRQQVRNVGGRLQRLRQGSHGMDASGLTFNVDGEALPTAMLPAELRGGGGAGDMVDVGRWGIFVNGSLITGSRSSSNREVGFGFDSLSLTVGADYRINPAFFAGGAVGISRNEANLRSNTGEVEVDGYSASLFATKFFPSDVYLDGIVTLGRHRYDTTRVVFPGDNGQNARSRPRGRELALAVNAGIDHDHGPWTFGFQGSAEYVRLGIDGYEERPSNGNETGFGSLLTIRSQSVSSLTTEAALQITYAQPFRYGVLLPTARAGVEREFRDDSRQVTARFTHDPSAEHFSIRTDDPNRHYVNLGAGLSAQFAHGVSAFVFVESREGAGPTSFYRVDAGLRMEF